MWLNFLGMRDYELIVWIVIVIATVLAFALVFIREYIGRNRIKRSGQRFDVWYKNTQR